MSEREMRRKWFTVGVAISLSAATFAKPMSTKMDEPWPTDENPELVAPMNYKLPSDLTVVRKRAKRVKQIPWTGSYFPSSTGSTAIPWRRYKDATEWPSGLNSPAFDDRFYTMEDFAAMDPKEAARIMRSLPSVQKLDILAGNAYAGSPKFYRNTRKVQHWAEAAIRKAPHQMDFHGLCGGFSAASIYLPEPQEYVIPLKYSLPNGAKGTLPLSFGSSDFKANASYFYARKTWNFDPKIYSGQIGNRSGALNAGAFHVLLMTLVGDAGESFGVDTAVGEAVWNYPVVGFRTVVQPARAISVRGVSAEAVKEVEVDTVVEYMGTSDPTGYAQGALSDSNVITKRYHYLLELNERHEVLGGTWLSDSEQVDFAWKLQGPISMEGDPEFSDYAKMMPYWVAQPRQ